MLMSLQPRRANDRGVPGPLGFWARGVVAILIAAGLWIPAGAQSAAGPPWAPDAKKAKTAFQRGMKAEKQQDWSAAYSAYSDAVGWAPTNHEYELHRELARSQVMQ